MARSTAPPGPPPPHYRPAGAPSGAPPAPVRGFGTPPPSQGPAGAGAGAITAIALLTLLVGLVVGFFLGRAVEADRATSSSAPPLTSPSTSTTRPPGDTIPQNPPVDPDAPPSTDLDPTTIGTFEDPVPVGQSYILGLYEIEVRGVERDADATVAAASPGNPAPPDGEQFVLVEIAVGFTDDGVGNPGAIPFFVSDGTGRWTDVDARCGIIPDSLLDVGLVEKGREVVGTACFSVPSDVVDQLMLGTEGFSGPVYFALPE